MAETPAGHDTVYLLFESGDEKGRAEAVRIYERLLALLAESTTVRKKEG